MNTAGDYHDLHLKTDVLLLADVFEKFINTCLEYYGSDPCHYFSNPGLSWDSMLEMTDDWDRIRIYLRRWHAFVYWKKEWEEAILILLKNIVKK